MLPRQRYGNYEIAQVTTAAHACTLVRELGPRAYDISADGHLGLRSAAIAIQETADSDVGGRVIGVAEICLTGERLCLRRTVTRGDAADEEIVRLVANALSVDANISAGFAARQPVGGVHPNPRRQVLQKRWLQLVGDYLAAPGIDPGLRTFLRHKDLITVFAVLEGLRGIASRFQA